jgi:hypothetical protein
MERTTPIKPYATEASPKRPLAQVEVINFRQTPSKYTKDMPLRMYTMACLGLTVEQMANSTGVGFSTIKSWITNRKEVRTQYERGRLEHDFKMEMALKRKAEGYEYEETKKYSGVDSLGRPWSREVTQTIRVEPDTPALKYWLSNRQPERWRESYNHGTSGSTNVQINNINMENFSIEEKKLARSMAIKQLEGMNVIDES